ncbi:MAG: hypothetical protein ACFFDN_52480, partial [Candidatus Hodarchaeota archaeon]
EKENRFFLIIVVWILIAFTCMEIFKLINLPIVGIVIYYPLLGFTLFLWFISLFKKNIRDISVQKLILLLAIDIFLMIILIFVVVIILIISIFSYIFLTSYFILVGCYSAGKKLDEKLYYKKGAWLWRRLEYWGGMIGSLVLLFVFLIITSTAASITGVTELIIIAYIAVIIVIICIAIYGIFVSLIKKRLNGWLGTYFVIVTVYTFYLVLKVFMSLYSGSGGESSLDMVIVLIVLDLIILLYSIGSILGTKGEILAEKVKIFNIDSALLWLIFSKAAWEFAVNYPYGLFGGPQALGIQNVSNIGATITLIANVIILATFFCLTIIFGFYGINKYGIEKERMKAEKKDILLARKSGERKDDEAISNKEVYSIGKANIEKQSIDEENDEIFDEEINEE